MRDFKQYGDEIRFKYCPICGQEKKNPDFSVNFKTGKYYCQASGTGGNISEIPFYDEVKKACNEIGVQLFTTDSTSFNAFFNKHARPFNQNWINYLAKRGIKSQCHEHTMCMDDCNRMIIPICGYNQKIVGIKYRTMEKKLTAEKNSRYDFFLNWPQIKQFNELVIVEGEIDLLSVLESGYPFVVSLAGGAGNVKVFDTQKNWLRQFKKIILAVDNDEAGDKCKKKIIEKMDGIVPLYEVSLGKYKDFNEVLVNEGGQRIIKIIESATKIEPNLNILNTADDFFEKDGCYFQKINKFSMEQITDFTLKLKGYSNQLIIGTAYFQDGRIKEFKCNKDDVFTPKEIAKNIGGLYLGKASGIIKFWHWVFTQNNMHTLQEIDFYGIIGDAYYTPYSDVVCNRNDLEIIDNTELDPLTDTEYGWLKDNILHLRNDPIQSLLGVTWALGRLHTLDNPYPILEVCGTTSIGKTEYVEFICKILQGTRANIKNFSTMTNHQIRTLGASSNITPLAIDEIKISSKFLTEKAQYLYSAMRTLYDNKQFDLGNITSRLETFLAKTPLIVSGESELSDNSIKNRMVSVSLTLNNKTEWEIYEKFKTSDILEKFGTLAINDRLVNGEIDFEHAYFQNLFPNLKDDRQFYNACCLTKGLNALRRIMGGIVSPDLEQKFYEFLSTNSKENIVIETFEILLDYVLASSEGEFSSSIESFYICTATEHLANFHKLYTRIKQEHANANSTLELLDEKALKRQLREVGYIVDDRYGKKINGKTEYWVKFKLKMAKSTP